MIRSAGKVKQGDMLVPFEVETLYGAKVAVPDQRQMIHLQFRRYGGCPICNLHLHQIARRHTEIVAAGIRELVVFHSSAETMRPYQGSLPFDVVADPARHLYRAFGVETSLLSVLNPKAWPGALRAVRHGTPENAYEGEGRFGRPADMLIDSRGRVIACKYGKHADDQWSVDELLALAGTALTTEAAAPIPRGDPAAGRV